jgi:hypothetical protein
VFEAKRRNERLIALFFVGLLALNFPLLSLFSKVALWMGIPVLYLYLFLFWLLLIGLVAAVMERTEPSPPASKSAEPGKSD